MIVDKELVNPATTIRCAVPVSRFTTLAIYNALGQVVETISSVILRAGFHEVHWNTLLPSGLYFYRLTAVATDNSNKQFVNVKKMIVLKVSSRVLG